MSTNAHIELPARNATSILRGTWKPLVNDAWKSGGIVNRLLAALADIRKALIVQVRQLGAGIAWQRKTQVGEGR
jgi:hypothetical protein